MQFELPVLGSPDFSSVYSSPYFELQHHPTGTACARSFQSKWLSVDVLNRSLIGRGVAKEAVYEGRDESTGPTKSSGGRVAGRRQRAILYPPRSFLNLFDFVINAQ